MRRIASRISLTHSKFISKIETENLSSRNITKILDLITNFFFYKTTKIIRYLYIYLVWFSRTVFLSYFIFCFYKYSRKLIPNNNNKSKTNKKKNTYNTRANRVNYARASPPRAASLLSFSPVQFGLYFRFFLRL